MKKLVQILRLSGVIILFISNSQWTHAQTVRWDALNDSIQLILDQNHIVGAGLTIVSAGSNLESYFGLADKESKSPVDEQTLFHWASITKTFTGICAMQAVREGLLDPDKPMTYYLPETRAIHNPYGSVDDITVRHLMSHSSGLRNPTWPWGGQQDWHPFEPTKWSQLVAMMPYTEIQFAPGSRYSYSNPGITFLGKILENLYDEDIEIIVRKRLLMPLEMHHAYFDVTPPYLQLHRSNSYAWTADGQFITHGKEFDTGITKGNGGLNVSFQEMTRYVQFLLQVAKGDDTQLLTNAEWAQMTQPVLSTDEPEESIGTIFFILHRTIANKEYTFFGHTGSQQGFRAFLYIDPQSGQGVIFNMNTELLAKVNGETSDKSRDVLYRIRELVFKYLAGNNY